MRPVLGMSVGFWWTVPPALVAAATSGEARFFLGTDSAPHPTHAKESECCSAGCFTAPVALACLAQTFDDAGALDKLEGFTSLHGPAFYGLPVNTDTVTLTKSDSPVTFPKEIKNGADPVTVFNPGSPVYWSAP